MYSPPSKGPEISPEVVSAENSMKLSSNTVVVLNPEDSETLSTRIGLLYSTKEANTIQTLFSLIALNQFNALKDFILQTPEDKRDDLLKAFVSLAIGSGTPLRMNGNQDAFKPNSDASKIIQYYWSLVGRKYLKEILEPTITQLAVNNKKMSLELDPTKLDPSELEDISRYRTLVSEHMTQLVNRITSPESLQKIPIPIKTILNQVSQFGKDRGRYYCGILLVSNFLCAALDDPIAFNLVPGRRFLSSRIRRNFHILASLLRNVMGTPQAEASLLGRSDLLREFRNQVETFLEAALKVKSMDAGDRFFNEIPSRPLYTIHKLILNNQLIIQKVFRDDINAEFSKLLPTLANYHNKLVVFFGLEGSPTENQNSQIAENKKVREAAKNWLEQKNDIAVYIGWVDKKKKNGQLVKRLLLVALNRLVTFKPTGKLAREAHLLDLTALKSNTPKEFQIQAQQWFISGESDEVDQIVSCIRRVYEYSFATIPIAMKFKVDVQPSARLEAISPPDRSNHENMIVSYKSACSYMNVPVKQSIISHIAQYYSDDYKAKAPAVSKTFNLKHIYKHTIDVPTAQELEPVLFAIRHNWHFDSLRIRNFRLEKGLFSQVVEIMRLTNNITTLTLDNTSTTREGAMALADALQANKNLKLRYLNISNIPLGDKAAPAVLIQYLSTHPNPTLTRLDLVNLGITKEGTLTLASDILPKCPSLTYLDLSGNKLDIATQQLAAWAVTANNLQTLILNGAAFKTRMLAPALAASQSLTKLDLSNRRIIKKEDIVLLSQFTKSATSLQDLLLEKTQLTPEAVKEVATDQFRVQFSQNVLGLAGAQGLLSTKLLEHIKELRLDDTELGDDGVASLCSGLINHPTLRFLSMARGFKGSEGSKNRITAVTSMAKVIQAGGVLEVLHIPGGSSANYQLKGHVCTILAALQKNNVLTDIDISSHQSLNQGAVSLANALSCNYTLSTVAWDQNGTGTLGIANVKNALKRNLAVKNMPIPLIDVLAIHKDDRISQLELQKLATLVKKLQLYLLRNQQL